MPRQSHVPPIAWDDFLGRQMVRGAWSDLRWFNVKLDSWSFDGAIFENCVFEDVIFSRFEAWSKSQTIFRDCFFSNCRWRPNGIGGGTVGDLRLERCTFEGGWWKGWICHEVELLGCALALELSNVSLAAVGPNRRRRNQIHGNDFSRANLRLFSLRGGVDIAAQSWNPDEHILIPNAKSKIIAALNAIDDTWSSINRRKGRAMLEVFLDEIDEGQADLLISKADLIDRDLAKLLS